MSWFFGGGGSSTPTRPRTPAPTVLGPAPTNTGTAVPRQPPGSTIIGSPAPPDASLAASNAAIAAQAAADKARKKATAGSGATVLTGMPGASTPTAKLSTKTLLGY